MSVVFVKDTFGGYPEDWVGEEMDLKHDNWEMNYNWVCNVAYLNDGAFQGNDWGLLPYNGSEYTRTWYVADVEPDVKVYLTGVYVAPAYDPDQEVADAIIGMIDDLPAASDITADDKEFIEAVRASYEELTDAQKELVGADNLAKLVAAEQALAEANQPDADQVAADAVAAMMNALPDPENVTAGDKDAIAAAGYAYAALTNTQKALIAPTVVARYRAIAEAFAVVAEETANQEAADGVTYLIDQIPDEVTENDREAVENARKAYEMLTDAQKELISAETLEKLTAAENTLAALEKPVNKSYLDSEAVGIGSNFTVIGDAEGGAGDYTYEFSYRRQGARTWTAFAGNTTLKFRSKGVVEIKAVVTDKNGATDEIILTGLVIDPLINTSTAPSVKAGERAYIYGSAEGGEGDYTFTYYYKRTTARKWSRIGAENTTETSVSFKTSTPGAFDVLVIVTDSEGTTAEMELVLSVMSEDALENNSTISDETVAPGTRVYITPAGKGGSGVYQWYVSFRRVGAKNWTELNVINGVASFVPRTLADYEVIVELVDSDGSFVEKDFTVNVVDLI